MSWVHRLSNKNTVDMTADCNNCGLVSIKKTANGFRCREAVNAEKRKSHLAKQGAANPGVCEACSGTNKVSFDHDHKTGEHRGWLCHNCNTALGLLKDNPKIIENLKNYLLR